MDLKDQETLERLAKNVLGPIDLRSSDKPVTTKDGTYKGGTAFERSYRAKEVKGARCYTTAYSFQEAPRIASTTVGSKRTGSDRENLNLRTNVNLVRRFPSVVSCDLADFRTDRPDHRGQVLRRDCTSQVLQGSHKVRRHAEHSERWANAPALLHEFASEHFTCRTRRERL